MGTVGNVQQTCCKDCLLTKAEWYRSTHTLAMASRRHERSDPGGIGSFLLACHALLWSMDEAYLSIVFTVGCRGSYFEVCVLHFLNTMSKAQKRQRDNLIPVSNTEPHLPSMLPKIHSEPGSGDVKSLVKRMHAWALKCSKFREKKSELGGIMLDFADKETEMKEYMKGEGRSAFASLTDACAHEMHRFEVVSEKYKLLVIRSNMSKEHSCAGGMNQEEDSKAIWSGVEKHTLACIEECVREKVVGLTTMEDGWRIGNLCKEIDKFVIHVVVIQNENKKLEKFALAKVHEKHRNETLILMYTNLPLDDFDEEFLQTFIMFGLDPYTNEPVLLCMRKIQNSSCFSKRILHELVFQAEKPISESPGAWNHDGFKQEELACMIDLSYDWYAVYKGFLESKAGLFIGISPCIVLDGENHHGGQVGIRKPSGYHGVVPENDSRGTVKRGKDQHKPENAQPVLTYMLQCFYDEALLNFEKDGRNIANSANAWKGEDIRRWALTYKRLLDHTFPRMKEYAKYFPDVKMYMKDPFKLVVACQLWRYETQKDLHMKNVQDNMKAESPWELRMPSSLEIRHPRPMPREYFSKREDWKTDCVGWAESFNIVLTEKFGDVWTGLKVPVKAPGDNQTIDEFVEYWLTQASHAEYTKKVEEGRESPRYGSFSSAHSRAESPEYMQIPGDNRSTVPAANQTTRFTSARADSHKEGGYAYNGMRISRFFSSPHGLRGI